jgi:quercetin dioxygenase-like cupin family protein
MNEPVPPYVLTNKNCPAFWLADILWMPLAGSYLTNGNLCLLEQVCGTGIGGPQAHAHPSDEGLYVIEGHCTFHAGGKKIEAGPGTFVSVPRWIEHSFTVDIAGSRLLNFYTPAGFEMLLMSIAMPAPERKAPEPGGTPVPPRWMVEECSREFGQIEVRGGLPFAERPTDASRVTKPSQINPLPPYGVGTQDAPAYWSENILWTILADSEQTGGSYSLMEQLCAKDSGAPPHTHEQDEALYILEGEIVLAVGAQKTVVKAGSLAYIPARCVHSFKVTRHETKLLNFYLPGGFERVITESGLPAEARILPPPGIKTRGSPEGLEALLKRVGMTPVAQLDS